MKRIIIGGTMLAAIVIGVAIYLNTSEEKNISHTLSARAREYMQDRKDANDKAWRSVDADGASDSVYESGTKVSVDECFSLIVPFTMSEARQEGHCSYRLFLSAPKGYVVAYMKEVSATSLDDLPDVKMRRLYPEKYTEDSTVSNGVRFITFKGSADSYEKSAFYLSSGGLYVVNLIVQTNEDLDNQFDRLLSSVEGIMK